jgi:hypothetical protein
LGRPVAANELVHGVDEGSQLVVGPRLSIRQIPDRIREIPDAAVRLLAMAGQGETHINKLAYHARAGLNLACIFGNLFVVSLRRHFQFGLSFQDELHGLFDVHC